jgi:serine/threonine protein kinase
LFGSARAQQRRWRMPPDVAAGDEVWEGGGRRYRTEKVVGNGAFGIVWRAREEGSSEVVAIKKVVLDRRYHNRELEMMRGLDHECVIKLHHSFEKP